MHKYAVAYSLLVISSFASVHAARPFRIVRQNTVIGAPPISQQSPSATPPSTPDNTSPPARPTITTPTTPTTPATPVVAPTTPVTPTTPPPSSSSSASASASSSSTTLSASASDTSASASSTLPQDSITSASTNAAGQVQTVTVPASADAASASASPSATETSSNNGDNDSSIKPGTIIGLSVAGGIAAIAVIAFIIWKLTRKRFSDLDDPDEAIKWPELNRESHLGGDGLSRQLSNSYTPSRNASTMDHQSEVSDPYAVPPLPQFNPNQPYRDDPAAYGASGAGYYDPYRGPVPQTFHDGSIDGHESIPMNTYPPGSRSRSPGPGPSYDMGGRGSPAPGRASPAMFETGGRGSPAPGRTISPGPAAALGLDRRPSPGPPYTVGGQPEMISRP